MDASMQGAFMAGVTAARGRFAQLIEDYGSIKAIDPAVVTLRRSQANDLMFQQAMSNDYKLFSNRSSNLEDFEINIFEAAFLKLMEDMNTHAGAIQIYVEEILGLKTLAQPLRLRALTNAVRVRTMFLNLATTKGHIQPSPTLNNPQCQYPIAFTQNESGKQILDNIASRPRNLPVQYPSGELRPKYGHLLSSSIQPKTTINYSRRQIYPLAQTSDGGQGFQTQTNASSTVTTDDPKLADLLSIYNDAKTNFRMTAANTTAHLSFATFLRDRAQQCFECMSKISPGDIRLDELCHTYAEASSVIEKGEQVSQWHS
ncbi:MAG: hypothetical protein Q9225_006183 [Loekoesia sp. 1 TL-2023]